MILIMKSVASTNVRETHLKKEKEKKKYSPPQYKQSITEKIKRWRIKQTWKA